MTRSAGEHHRLSHRRRLDDVAAPPRGHIIAFAYVAVHMVTDVAFLIFLLKINSDEILNPVLTSS